MLSLLIWSNLEQLHTSLSAQTQTRLNESTTLLQSALSAPLVQMDYATAKAIMTETQQLKGIEYLVVLDREHNRLIQVGWEGNHPLPKIEHEAFSDESLADNRFDTRIPLTLGGTPLGTLAIGLSTQFYTQARQDALLRSLGIALLELLFSALLLVSLNYWLGKKFIRLTEQAQAIAQGDYAQRLSTSEHQEYDQLVTAFNQMTDAVAQKISQLEIAHDEQKRLNQKVIHLVNYDSLTNIASRYSLDSYLNIAINQKQKIALFLIDLDGFKFINDNFGHQFGDQLLKTFALFLAQNIPQEAFLARLGGDEFIVIINETDSKQLAVIANKLCVAIAEHSFQVNRQQLQITSSIGYSRFPDDAKDVQQLLNQADIAMYRAKAVGKNSYRAYIPDYE